MFNNRAYTHSFGKWESVNCHLFQLLKAFKIHFYLLLGPRHRLPEGAVEARHGREAAVDLP